MTFFSWLRAGKPTNPSIVIESKGVFLSIQLLGELKARRQIAADRLRLGIAHAKANAAVIRTEEALIARYPGESFTVPGGVVVRIGTPGCRLYDRIRIDGTSTQYQ